MQRVFALRQLSSDHHRGLVLARRAREKATTGPEHQARAWGAVREAFVQELEPHFQLEEQNLLPALEHAGASELVAQTLQEHRQLRTLVAKGQPRDLAAFAQTLSDHIRFEETRLFETAQRVLDEATLTALAERHAEGARRACEARLAVSGSDAQTREPVSEPRAG
ncbi:hemerythrin domain-containing protein [Allochromatium palmeri]|uniref:Hemerythrin domain-containing protein n=2 Tax=Allochromatium palmeri TaxID=231048 RepID=A0A6N8EIS1_9GAMM|nr:hemerythrin domain-containing protein [Allochromatium palmeri]MTW22224.1 hemerythrin domain-containing protein [Allochromatium palmeri]